MRQVSSFATYYECPNLPCGEGAKSICKLLYMANLVLSILVSLGWTRSKVCRCIVSYSTSQLIILSVCSCVMNGGQLLFLLCIIEIQQIVMCMYKTIIYNLYTGWCMFGVCVRMVSQNVMVSCYSRQCCVYIQIIIHHLFFSLCICYGVYIIIINQIVIIGCARRQNVFHMLVSYVECMQLCNIYNNIYIMKRYLGILLCKVSCCIIKEDCIMF